ncbi:MAG: hypothetical protein ACLT8E_10195 [Akkermansia sp.]
METEDQFEIWQERQTAPESCAYAGPLFPWPEHWEGRGKAAYTRGSAVLHVENMVTAMRRFFMEQGRFVEADVSPADIRPDADGLFHWNGRTFSHIVWCTGWEAGLHPDMSPLKGRPSKGTILDLDLKELDWHAGILHFGHWLVHNGSFWRWRRTRGRGTLRHSGSPPSRNDAGPHRHYSGRRASSRARRRAPSSGPARRRARSGLWPVRLLRTGRQG